MKKIEAIVRPLKHSDIKKALQELGIKGMTVTEVNGFGYQIGNEVIYRSTEYHLECVPKVKMEIFVEDDLADKVIATIKSKAYSGEIGDGKISVSPVETLIRIRTGETGINAI